MERDKKKAQPPLTAADLDWLHALHEAATPGPWREYANTVPIGYLAGQDVRADVDPSGKVCRDATLPDVRLIAAARNALPSLLALARRGLEADTAEQRMESALELVRHNAIRAESAESKLAAALAEVERVRGRLAAIPCASCSGRGEFDYCSMCSDSGHDHICPPARKCRDCAGTGKAFAAEAQAGQAAKQGGEGQT